MVIVQLVGGIGNQMFQYAAGISLAKSLNTELKLDTSAFRLRKNRPFALDCFRMSYQLATDREIKKLTASLKTKIFRRINSNLLIRFRNFYQEKTFHFDPNYLGLTDETYIKGYWQSPRYFSSHAELIQSDFTFKAFVSDKAYALTKEIEKTNAVAIHFRRGDYVTHKTSAQFHGTCSLTYYQDAIEKIAACVKDPFFCIFSDEVQWVKENFSIAHPCIYISDHGLLDWEEMKLLSSCKYQIIANSTFSWWAAWLNTYEKKMVIAPKKWFRDSDINTSDLIPSSWVRI